MPTNHWQTKAVAAVVIWVTHLVRHEFHAKEGLGLGVVELVKYAEAAGIRTDTRNTPTAEGTREWEFNMKVRERGGTGSVEGPENDPRGDHNRGYRLRQSIVLEVGSWPEHANKIHNNPYPAVVVMLKLQHF